MNKLKDRMAEFLLDMRDIRDTVKNMRTAEWLEIAAAETMDDAVAHLQEVINLVDLHLAEVVNAELVDEGKLKPDHKYEKATFSVFGGRRMAFGAADPQVDVLRTVKGYACKGLGITRVGSDWYIYHIKSSRPICGFVMASKADAINAANELIASGRDWTLSFIQLRDLNAIHTRNGAIVPY